MLTVEEMAMRHWGSRTLLAAAVFAALLPAGAAASPDTRDALVVTASWLGKHLADPELVLLHVGDKDEYEAGHIAGARLLALQDISRSDSGPGGLVLEMLPAEELRERLAGLGLSDGSRVVVCHGKGRLVAATRVVFTLDYAGLGDRAALLDGGLEAWVRGGGSLTKDLPAAARGTLAELRTRPLVVDAEAVRGLLAKPGVAVIDARAATFYDGTEAGGPATEKHRAGHIAGARNIPYTALTNEQNELRSAAELAALFEKAGVEPGDTVVAYCHLGMQATGILFAARTLGHPVLLYDGSFQDWSRHADYPVDIQDVGETP
jgi:thiosulfate/3-mercaptopyruvate sulfurtransferase